MVSSDESSTTADESDDEVASSVPQPPLSTRPPMPPPRIRSTVATCSLARSANPTNTGGRYSLRDSPQRTARAIAATGATTSSARARISTVTGSKTASATGNTSSAGTGTGASSSGIKRKAGGSASASSKLKESQKRARPPSIVDRIEESIEDIIEESEVLVVEESQVVQGSEEEEEDEDEEELIVCAIYHDPLGTVITGDLAVESLSCGHSFHCVCVFHNILLFRGRGGTVQELVQEGLVPKAAPPVAILYQIPMTT